MGDSTMRSSARGARACTICSQIGASSRATTPKSAAILGYSRSPWAPMRSMASGILSSRDWAPTRSIARASSSRRTSGLANAESGLGRSCGGSAENAVTTSAFECPAKSPPQLRIASSRWGESTKIGRESGSLMALGKQAWAAPASGMTNNSNFEATLSHHLCKVRPP